MADTTYAAIVARFHTVLQASPCSLVPSRDQFTHDRQPNSVLNSAYWLEDGGVAETQPQSSYRAARLDRLTVYVARKLAFAPVTEVDTLQDLLVTIERAIKADGPAQSYSAEVRGRRVTRPDGKDLAIASLEFVVDYDFNESAT